MSSELNDSLIKVRKSIVPRYFELGEDAFRQVKEVREKWRAVKSYQSRTMRQVTIAKDYRKTHRGKIQRCQRKEGTRLAKVRGGRKLT